jgi:hypothetical protein
MNPSLLLIPDRYKKDKLYSQIPDSGAGDLTFARNSNATRVNSAGLIEKVRENLVLQSEAFNTTWGAVNVSVSANTTANPLDGAVNADTITLTGGTDSKRVQQSLVHTGNFTQSIFLKAGTHQFIQLLVGNDVTPVANFDLVNGTTSASGASSQIISLGNGWFRCSMSYTSATATDVYLWAVDSLAAGRAASTASTGTFFAFGFQLETGDIATDYIPTTTAAVSVGITADIPRLDYTGGGCPSLLLEPQRTNFVNPSEDFSNAGFQKLASGTGVVPVVTTNQGAAPTGYANADRVDFNIGAGTTASDVSRILFSTTTAPVAGSVYLKSLDGVSTYNMFLRVANTTTPIVVTGEWQRFSAVELVTGSNLQFGLQGNLGTSASASVLAWGAQLEQGTYPTSYIPTLGSSVTRLADAASKTGISSLIGQTEGTLFFEGVAESSAEVCNLNRNTTNSVFIYTRSTGEVAAFVYADSVGLNLISAVPSSNRFKAAIAYKSNSIAFYVNGNLIAQNTTATFTPNVTMDRFDIGIGGFVSTKQTFTTNEALLFTTRLTNAQLASITSL